MYKDSEKCYLNMLNTSSLQNFTNTLNFDCDKLFAFENGDILVSLVNEGGDYVFYLQSNGNYKFFKLSEKIYDFYGATGNKVYYRTANGLKYAELSESAFTQNTKIINNVNNSAYNRVNPLEFSDSNLAAVNTGDVYSVSDDSTFTKELSFNRNAYTQSSGSLTAFVSNSNLVIGADGSDKLSAYDSSTFEYVSSVNTAYLPYMLCTNGSSVLCVEKNGNDYYLEIFEVSDFIKIEAEVINLNNEAVYRGRTKTEMAVRYSNVLNNADLNEYSLFDEGSLNPPFEETLIKSDVQSNLIDFSNYLRYLCGLSEYTYGGDSTAVTAGKGAVLLNTVWTRHNITGHTPPRPTDMDEDFYNDAYSVCGGNISYGYSSTLREQIKAIRGLNNDLNNASNYEINSGGYHQGYNTPGHRNTFLQRGGDKLTYGYADRVLLQYYEYAQSNPNATGTIIEVDNNEAAYAWPAPGEFPLEEIDPKAMWSVYFNTDKLDLGNKNPVVSITDLTTGEVFVRNTEMHDVDGQREGYATSNFWGKSICFTPPQTNSYAGKSYKVTIENLVNNQKLPAKLEYTINFFDYKGKYIIDGAEYEMDEYGKLTLISLPTEPSTQAPSTEEITTAEPVTTEPTEAPTTVEITTAPPATAEITSEPFETTVPDTTAAPTPQYLIGDVNGDGSIDTLDAIIVQKYSADKTKLNDRQIYVGDVNDDGYVDVLDAAMIQKFSVEKLKEFKKKH
ncbi:dockerin type I repeat-containing protein [Ruminococcus sp. JL13D9]|uniref:dockerin type I repeat-containing protein n=1 Tax=Ruminococcus sp. JL13D9 TaxID=3233381 RepID=UPI0038999B74